MRAGALTPDGRILMPTGEVAVTKVAIEPVWYLPGVAARCGIGESALRRSLFEQTGGMFPELVTRFDLTVFRSKEHKSELQSLMRISYAVFCLTKKKKTNHNALNCG